MAVRSTEADRRVHPRVPLRLLVQVRLQDVEQFMREHAMNLSVGGMFIRTEQPHPEGAHVYLQFRLDDGGTLIEGLGRVAHVNGPEDTVPGMGIEFVNLDEESREFIDAAINAHLSTLKAG